MTELDAPFRSAHDALTFAFRYASGQSPRTPMSRMLQGGPLGRGSGLVGLDGAGQAGLILAALPRMTAEQRAVLTVRYGDVRSACPCCGEDVPTREWRDALDMLSHCEELEDLPRKLRHAVVEKIICRRKHLSISAWASKYEANERTIRQRASKAKKRLAAVECQAMAWMTDHLEGRSVLSIA